MTWIRFYYVSSLQGRETYCFSPGVRLSVTNRVRSITQKPLKLYSRNFIQISISMIWRAECKNSNSAFYTFWVISLGTLCITKIVSALLLENRLSCIHIPLYKYQSAWYDVQSVRMVTLLFILFFSYFPWNFVQSMTILYQVKIVQWLIYLTEIFTRYEQIVCKKWLEFLLEIVFNVSVWNCIQWLMLLTSKGGETSVFSRKNNSSYCCISYCYRFIN